MKRFVRLFALLLALVTLVSFVAACSGEDESEVTPIVNNVNDLDSGEDMYYEPTPEENIKTNDDGVAYADNELLVVANEGVRKSEVEALAETYSATVIGYVAEVNYYQWRFDTVYSYEDLLAIIEKLNAESIIEFAEIQFLSRSAEEATYATPNDAEWNSEWDQSQPNGGNWGAEAIYAPFAWHYRGDMTPVRVGLMDSMFDTDHDDLAFSQTLFNPKNLTSSHGSHVAGTMAATFNNNEGIAGIYPYGALDDEDNTPNIYGYSYSGSIYSGVLSQIRGLRNLIVKNKVKVINVSYGFVSDGFAAARNEPGYRSALQKDANLIGRYLQKLIDYKYDFVIVQSAGNERNDLFKHRSDGTWVNVEHAELNNYALADDRNGAISGATQDNIADWNFYYSIISNKAVRDRILVVGAVGHDYRNGEVYYKLSEYSNIGSRVDVMAPGDLIQSCITGSDEYGFMSGTSMAAPHVSGVAASIWSYNTNLNGVGVKKAVKEGCFTDVEDTDVDMVHMLAVLSEGGKSRSGSNPARNPEWTITAEVYGEGELLPNVKVELLDKDEDVEKRGNTDENGLLTFNAGVGRYSLKLTADGYADTYVKDITVNMENVELGRIDLNAMVRDFTLPDSMDVTIGEVNVIEPTIIPEGAGNYTIKWTSSDDSILGIAPTGEAGIITARNKGSVTVTAELTSGSNVITRTTTVNVTSVARDTVLVLDISGSMRGTPLQEMKESAIKFCNDLIKDTLNNRVGLVFYDDRIESVPLTDDLESLVSIIDGVRAGGMTNMHGALKEADEMLKIHGNTNAIKNVVIMADGLPNEGGTSDSGAMADAGYKGRGSDVKYANAVIDVAKDMMSRYNMYSLGYFHSLYDSEKEFAVVLMKALTNKPDGYYQVDEAEDLQFAFGDITDEISEGAKIVINIACPVDVYVTYEGETLCSAEDGFNAATTFGSLKLLGKNKDIKVVTLDSDKLYDVEVIGTGEGTMDYSVNYFDETEALVDTRSFETVPITTETVITSDTDNTEDVVLNVDDNGDGVVDAVWTAPKDGETVVDRINEEEPEDTIDRTYDTLPDEDEGFGNTLTIVLIVIGVAVLAGGIVVLIILLSKKSGKKKDGNVQAAASSYTPAAAPAAPVMQGSSYAGPTAEGVIRILSGSMRGTNIPICHGQTINIGKDSRVAQVVFSKDYQFVSRTHCSVTYDAYANVYYVVDVSSNGTFYVNKERLQKGANVPVKAGTMLLLGTKNCTISLG